MKENHGGNVKNISRIYGISKEKIIDFSASINPLGCPPGLREAIIEDFDSVLHYPDCDSFDLVEGLSEYHDIGHECILAGNGSTEFIYWIPMIFRPRRALIVSPAFSEYERALAVMGTDVSYFRADEKNSFSVDIDDLCKCVADDFDIIYFCNPANPTGVLTPREELRRVAQSAGETGALLVVDEAFIDFVEEESFKREIHRSSHVIILRSMTKFFAIPGLRLGYIMASPSVIAKIEEHRLPWTVNSLLQGAAVKTLFDTDYIRETRKYIMIEREYLKDALNLIPGLRVFKSSANYLLVSIDGQMGLNAPELRKRLIPEGIVIRDCSNFQDMGDLYFRVAVKTHEQNRVLVESLRHNMR
ncbi:MAG: threonine-phosphate decarboxylase [Deltaproteobacteria bacterium]|nr:threonine-phosphate decarboxylase [Deltaproteobacteria bacterium]